MTHDPLCPAQDCDHSEHCSCFIDFGICLCQCSTLIAKVRADERERVVRAVYKDCAHTKYLGVEPCWHDVIVREIHGDSP